MKILKAALIASTLLSPVMAAKSKIVGFPAIASSNETGLQIGGLVMYFLPTESENERASNIGFALLASFKNQWQVSFFPEFYLTNNDRLKLYSKFTYWPTNYYGLGNNTLKENESKYLNQSIGANVTYEHNFFDFWWLGAKIDMQSEEVEWDAAGIQDEEPLYGEAGTFRLGIGYVTSLDFRDHHNAPSKGLKISNEQMFYPKAIGSDYTYFAGKSQIIGFFSPIEEHVLAASIMGSTVMGDVPFRDLNSPDGTSYLRGVARGRYRGNALLAMSAEYRTPHIYNTGLVLYSDWAQVSSSWSDIQGDNFHISPGLGIRYALNPDEKFHIRADFSLLHGSEFQMTINIKECF
jgi:hypothetical protein